MGSCEFLALNAGECWEIGFLYPGMLITRTDNNSKMKSIGLGVFFLIFQCVVSCKSKQTSTFEYYPDGKIKSENRPINDSVSIFLRFYSNGNVRDSMTTLNGYLSGEARHFFENGKLRQVWTWKDGLPNGASKTYYESGRVMDALVYRDSVPVGNMVKYFDLPGERVMYSANNARVNGKKWVNWYVKYDSSGKIMGASPGIKRIVASNRAILGDSLKIVFDVQYPQYQKTKVYFGDYDEDFKLNDSSSIKGAYGTKDRVEIFAPAIKIGKQTVRGVLENYRILDSLKSGFTRTEGKMIYWSYDYEVLPRN
jgi:antitoxin component YwqK of YwqJK toxin-antitoxin module